MMNNQNKQIIPDSQAVANCQDGTFLIGDLLEKLKSSIDDQGSFANQLKALSLELKAKGHSRDHRRDKIEAFIDENTDIANKETNTIELFENGVDCNLLQLDGKGWQKGKLRICFEFIPEDDEDLIIMQENPVNIHDSSLDEIRQLANSSSIEQN
jgi:hypothetical protein